MCRPLCARLRGRLPAFTLIELLVVVAIIAVLISILLPSLGRAREQTRTASCQANFHNLGLALTMYADANRGYFPQHGYTHGGGDALAAQAWINTMIPYIGATWREGPPSGSTEGARRALSVFRCPSDRSPHWSTPRAPTIALRRTSYATNYYLATAGEDNPAWTEDDPANYNRLDNIKRPALTIMFVELAETGEYAEADHVHPENWAYNPEDIDKQLARRRHLGRASCGFVDGRAEVLPFERTFHFEGDIFGDHVWIANKYNPTIAR